MGLRVIGGSLLGAVEVVDVVLDAGVGVCAGALVLQLNVVASCAGLRFAELFTLSPFECGLIGIQSLDNLAHSASGTIS